MRRTSRPKTFEAWISNLDERLRTIETRRRLLLGGFSMESDSPGTLLLKNVRTGETTSLVPGASTTVVEAGTNVTVTGTGSSSDPYVVSSESVDAPITFALDVVIKLGPAGVATNVFPSGSLIPFDCRSSEWTLRCNVNHLPTGSPLTVNVKRAGSTIVTISVPPTGSINSVFTAVDLLKGDLLTYDITSVGNVSPAWDVAVMMVAT